MSDRPGSLVLAACFALVFAVRTAAQPPQPIVAPGTAAPEFLTRYDCHLSIASLMPSAPTPAPPLTDKHFSWDARFDGSFEFADRVVERLCVLGIFASYEKRVDADPLDRLSQRWGLLGFRVASR